MLKNIITLLLILGAMGIFITWTSPFLKEIGQLYDEKKAIIEVLETSSELIGLRNEAVAKFNLISAEELARFSKIIPEDADTNKLMVQLSNMADTNGLAINSLDFREETEKSKVNLYNTLNIEAVFEGSYYGFLSFLEELEKSLRLVEVDSISFSTTEENIYEFSIKAKTYFKK